MRLLLDTHALLWALLDPERIPPATLAQVRDPRVTVFVSAASAWEVATKHRLGRLPEAEPVVTGYEAHIARLGATELPISARHAWSAGRLTWAHRDPFDRILVSQSLIESIPLVTMDSAIRDFPGGVAVVW